MTAAPATAALRHVLAHLAGVAAPGEIDHVWLFAPRDLAGRESGLLVLSLRAGDDASAHRRLLTVAYESEGGTRELRVSRTVTEQGRAPADRIPRLMQGVLARLRDEPGDPVEESIRFDPARWAALLERHGVGVG
jgi:hypothetical protein